MYGVPDRIERIRYDAMKRKRRAIYRYGVPDDKKHIHRRPSYVRYIRIALKARKQLRRVQMSSLKRLFYHL